MEPEEKEEVAEEKIGKALQISNGNEFRIAYEQFGVIVKAWVIDEEGNELKVLVDRTDEFGTWEDI